jgi:hypothetical protein
MVETGGPRTYDTDTGFPSVRAHSLTRPFVALNFKTTCSGGVMVLALHCKTIQRYSRLV